MKRVSLIIGLYFAVGSLFAQDIVEPDSRMLARYSESRVSELIQENPARIDWMNFELENGYEIIQMDEAKVQDLPFLFTLNLDDKADGVMVQEISEQSFNLYLYNFKRDQNNDNYYRIGYTGQVLKIQSKRTLVKQYNESKHYENL